MLCDFNYVRARLANMIADKSAAHQGVELNLDCQFALDIINAMTPEERSNCDLLVDCVRRERIARDAAVSLADVDAIIVHRQALADALARMR